ncbi:DNA polymerase III subunit delta [Sphingomonas sp. ID0503]|uniref:DNA polymerase III subunit delta n=1 Tax=Sphingomonas sp. ID0503 TaxID=3399691 RepID=UPI003AFB6BC0
MIVKRGEIERALDRPAGIRLFLLYGPDESSSRALADRLGKGLGPDAERIDLSGAVLKGDPARLADEAAAISMFGGPRYIRVDPAGDESVEAAAALLGLTATSDPVVLIAGALRKDSKLLKLVADHRETMVFVSYALEGREADQLAMDLARAEGLEIRPDAARRLVDAAAGDRAVLASEISKLALYVDAEPGGRVEAGHDALDALLASGDEGDQGALIDAVLDGRADLAQAELARLGANGTEGIPILRALERKLLLLARLRGEVDQGNAPAVVVKAQGKAIFWKEQDRVTRQLARWRGPEIARALDRVLSAERAVMSSRGPGTIAADAELLAIARFAERLR